MRLTKSMIVLTMLLWSALSFGQTEMVEQRTIYSKTYHMEGDQYRTVLSSIPLHYRNAEGQFREIPAPEFQFRNLQKTQGSGLAKTADNSNLPPAVSGSYGQVDYEYYTTTYNYDTEEYDTTYSNDTAYLTMTNGWTVTGQYYDDDWNYQVYNQSEGEVSEIDEEMNWRSLLSWNPSGTAIFSTGTVDINSVELTLSYWGALTETAFNVELRNMGTHTINTTAITESEYEAVAAGELIETLNLQLTQQSLEEQSFTATSGTLYDSVVQALYDGDETFTIGLNHESESYSGYDQSGEVPYAEEISGTIVIDYTVDSVTLINQRRGVPGRNVGGKLSLNRLGTGTGDYLNKDSDSTVPIFEGQQYTVWTHDQWLEDDGTDVLHYDWNGNANDYTLEKANFSMPENINTLAANFDDPATVTISSPGGNLEIQDPWLAQNTTDFTEVTSGVHRIFLDQNPDFQPGIPTYRLRAPDVTQYDNTDWYFMQWSGSHVTFQNSTDNTTPVVFTDAGAEVTADYKGHLRSEYSQPSNYNNTATLTYQNGTYRYLYRDFGRLYSTTSFNYTSTWQPETSVASSMGPDYGVSMIYAGDDKYITAFEDGNLLSIYTDSDGVVLDEGLAIGAQGGIDLRPHIFRNAAGSMFDIAYTANDGVHLYRYYPTTGLEMIILCQAVRKTLFRPPQHSI